MSPPHCSATATQENGRTNGVSEDKSDNEPNGEDECRIDSGHFLQSLDVLSQFRTLIPFRSSAEQADSRLLSSLAAEAGRLLP
jgi:hypothetical protein